MDPLHAATGSSFLARARSPLATGHVARIDGLGRGENEACGDQLELSLQVSDVEGQSETRIQCAGYRAMGCSSLLASASLVCEHVGGMTLRQARELDCVGFLASQGGPPPRGAHAAALVSRALTQALDGVLAKSLG